MTGIEVGIRFWESGTGNKNNEKMSRFGIDFSARLFVEVSL